MKLDEKTLRALCNLRTNPDFGLFMEVIGTESENCTKSLIMNEKLDSGQLYQLRGKTQAYVSIIDAIVQAPEKLENIITHKEPPHA